MKSILLTGSALPILVLSAATCVSAESSTSSLPSSTPTPQEAVFPVVRYISAGGGSGAYLATPLDLADLYTSLKITPLAKCLGTTAGANPPSNDSCTYNPAKTKDTYETVGPNDLGDPRDGRDSVSGSTEPERAYDKERPSWITRLFTTRTVNMVAVANASISDPDVSISVPLFSIEHKITHGSPDEYVTNYTSSHSATPLFRIGASSVFTLHVNEMISDDKSLTGLSSIIKAVQMATTIAAPQSSILTTLSSPGVQDASHAIESTVSGILSSHKTEDIELARDISLFFDGSDSTSANSGRNRQSMFDYSIVARVPSNFIKYSFEPTSKTALGEAADFDNKAKLAPIVGHWFVWMTCPRPSIFSPQDICDDNQGASPNTDSPLKPQNGLDTNGGYPDSLNKRIEDTKQAIIARLQGRLGQVLNTKLSSQVTVEDFVTSSSAYTSFFAKRTKTPEDTKKFCSDIIDTLYKQGLSNFDAHIVIWAMSRNLSDVLQLPTAAATTQGATKGATQGTTEGVDVPTNCNDLVNPQESAVQGATTVTIAQIPLKPTPTAPNPPKN